ncbi:MAG: hypothetical protein PHT69_02745 [Bacteroidales bacterium]|nr:hypothetical protein [Bacteroidales bacterium]
MKNLQKRKGFKNRHIDGLPTTKAIIKVVTYDVDGETIFICQWQPFDKTNIQMMKLCLTKDI